jgi:hypothetical protein
MRRKPLSHGSRRFTGCTSCRVRESKTGVGFLYAGRSDSYSCQDNRAGSSRASRLGSAQATRARRGAERLLSVHQFVQESPASLKPTFMISLSPSLLSLLPPSIDKRVASLICAIFSLNFAMRIFNWIPHNNRPAGHAELESADCLLSTRKVVGMTLIG